MEEEVSQSSAFPSDQRTGELIQLPFFKHFSAPTFISVPYPLDWG